MSMLGPDSSRCRFCGVSPPSSTAPPLTIVSSLPTVSGLRSSVAPWKMVGSSERRPLDAGARGAMGLEASGSVAVVVVAARAKGVKRRARR